MPALRGLGLGVEVEPTGAFYGVAFGRIARKPQQIGGRYRPPLAVRDIDPEVTTMAVFDNTLRAAAAAEGLAVSPTGPPAGR